MKFRKLRIAFSATCLLACASLIALWVRSYQVRDLLFLRYSSAQFLWIVSNRGRFVLTPRAASTVSAPAGSVWLLEHDKIKGKESTIGYPDKDGKIPNSRSFQVMRFTKKTELHVPQWFPVVLTAALGAVPWIPRFRRFGLRTLLITTTLVAVVLGLVCYAVW